MSFYLITLLLKSKVRGLIKRRCYKNKKSLIKVLMNYKNFEFHFSKPRVTRYLQSVGNDQMKAIALYKANLKLSKAFHPLLSILEVSLRNSINEVLSIHFGDGEWIINQQVGFMTDPSLTITKNGRAVSYDFILKSVSKSSVKIKKRGLLVTSGRIIADQTLSFWSELFAKHYSRILKGQPLKVFTQLPAGIGRKEIHVRLEKVRLFRNRIFHNEPVCFDNTAISFQQAEDIYRIIGELLEWQNVNILPFVKEVDNVPVYLAEAKSI